MQVTFKRPVSIIQIFRNIHVYGKEGKAYADRAEQLAWKEISSKAGYIQDQQLFLPRTIVDDPSFSGCDLITMEDNNDTGQGTPNRCFHFARRNVLDIFELKKGPLIELHLRYDHFEVGMPKRNNFKLCELKNKEPVAIKINGKLDHTLTVGRARTFKEQHYIFEYLGDFDACHLLREPCPPYGKKIPVHRKTVDLIKPLW